MSKKLVIGTANFLQEYKGHCVGESESARIIEYAVKNGVDTFDTADAYGTLNWINVNFDVKIQYKTDELIIKSVPENIEILLHHPTKQSPTGIYGGISVYDPDFVYHLTLRAGALIQTPFTKPDTLKQFKACGYHIQARNVVNMILHPSFKDIVNDLWFVDSFVVGVDNLKQTKELIGKYQEAVNG